MAISKKELNGIISGFDNDNKIMSSRQRNQNFRKFADNQHENQFDIDLDNLTTRLDRQNGILWSKMKHTERACYTPGLVSDSRVWQRYLKEQCASYEKNDLPFRYLVWSSQSKGAFSLGGDLNFFTQCVREGDERALSAYSHQCIDVLHDNYHALNLPILTVALVQGDAIGGGLESMLTNDIVIAERGAKFGLPEVLFNLFPGMGGYSFLKRKIGEKAARAFVEDGCSRSAEDMHELGLIDELCDPGEGEARLMDYLDQPASAFRAKRTMRKACKRVDPLSKTELSDIVDMWVDLAMELEPADLKRMDALARVQEKKRVK